jgi:hypothetical protein
MNIPKHYINHFFLLASIAILMMVSSACGQFTIGIETPTAPTATSDNSGQAQNNLTPLPQPSETLAVLTATPENSDQAQNNPTPFPQPSETLAPSPYWSVHTDSFTGISFATPCFWEVQLTEADPLTSNGGYMRTQNIPEGYAMQYPLAFPRGTGVFEIGGIKIEFVIFNLTAEGYPAGTSPLDYVTAQSEGDSLSTLVDTEEIEINGQAGLLVTSESNFGVGQYYLFSLSDQLLLLVNAFPEDSLNQSDMQGVINSISLSPGNPVVIPSHTPAAPLPGLAAACIPEYAEASDPPQPMNFNEDQTTECGVHSFASLDYLTDKVTSSLRNRDTGTLVYYGYINDPFGIGYWLGEGVSSDPLYVGNMLANHFLPPDPSTLTFTTDRAEFPPLFDMPPESMFGPDYTVAEIYYSEGWGSEGQGAALLYFMQDSCGGYYWHGMVIASDRHFDQ